MKSKTRSEVNIGIMNNASWDDAFQFSTPSSDLQWNLDGQGFVLQVKHRKEDTVILVELSTNASTIIIDDSELRVIHLNYPPNLIQENLIPGEYVYDLLMFDEDGVVVNLMGGELKVIQGITDVPST